VVKFIITSVAACGTLPFADVCDRRRHTERRNHTMLGRCTAAATVLGIQVRYSTGNTTKEGGPIMSTKTEPRPVEDVNTDSEPGDQPEEDKTNLAQKIVIVCAAVYTVVFCVINTAMVLEWKGDFWEACYDFTTRYALWIVAVLGVLAVATWAAGQFNRRDVREDRALELAARQERNAKRRERVTNIGRSRTVEPAAPAGEALSAPTEAKALPKG
jgi:hypothetical protein